MVWCKWGKILKIKDWYTCMCVYIHLYTIPSRIYHIYILQCTSRTLSLNCTSLMHYLTYHVRTPPLAHTSWLSHTSLYFPSVIAYGNRIRVGGWEICSEKRGHTHRCTRRRERHRKELISQAVKAMVGDLYHQTWKSL